MERISILAIAIMLSLSNTFAPATAQELRGEASENLQLSCGAARSLLVREGYQDIIVRNCFTGDYRFTANRDGKPRRVFVDPQNGRMWEG